MEIQNFIKISVLVFLICMSKMLMAQHQELYANKYFASQSDTLHYRIMMPKDFDDSKQYPVLLFLHGAGERGHDNKAQLVHGSKLLASDKNRSDFPAIVIFPQCPKDSYWASATIDRSTKPLGIEFPLDAEPTKALSLVLELMDEMMTKPYVNKNQVYVGGLSMGGMGTFEIVYRSPNMFAAAFSICGAGNPDATKTYAKLVPFWVFHGANDDVISPQSSLKMVSGILKHGGTPNFNLYAKDNHNSWDTALADPNLLPWLFSNKKN